MMISTRLQLWILPGLVAALGTIGLSGLGALSPLEQSGYNTLTQLRSRVPMLTPRGWDDQIAVIAIDEDSLAQYGRYPWPRERYAELLEELSFVQPSAIGFDVLFPEAAEDDSRLAEAIIESNNVVLAIGVDGAGRPIYLNPQLEAQLQHHVTVSHVNHRPDSDGVSRQAFLCQGDVPAFSMAMVQISADSLAHTLVDTTAISASEMGVNPCPQDDASADDASVAYTMGDRTKWISWPGPIPPENAPWQDGDLHSYSFVDVMSGRVDLDVFQNKIVLVGVTATGIDPARSPFNYDPPTAGVYVHAAIIDNWLNQGFLARLSVTGEIALLLVIGLGTSFLLSTQDLKGRIVVVFGLPLVGMAISVVSFAGNFWMPVAAPVATILMTTIGLQWKEQLEKQQIMDLFSIYVSPKTAELIWSRRDDLLESGQVQPQELMATVLFMDIRGFTAIAESMPSRELIHWLNGYFEIMSDCIMEQGGVVDKYIGDAIMAVFGIPFPRLQSREVQQDALAAVQASMAMFNQLQRLNTELKKQQLPTIQIGIGIHTGMVIAGSVGSRKRANYSVFGDTVNMAARLESMTKTLPPEDPYKILMSAQTFTHVSQYYPGRAFGHFQLRGRSSETMAYTLIDPVSQRSRSPLPTAG